MAITTSFEIGVITPDDVKDPDRLLQLLTVIKLKIEEIADKGQEA